MTIQQAIEKAIEGGYYYGDIGVAHIEVRKGEKGYAVVAQTEGSWAIYALEIILMSPLFWQSLGKAMGWCEYAVCIHDGKMNCFEKNHWAGYMGEWKWHWHRFIDHLAEGKDAESFFEAL